MLNASRCRSGTAEDLTSHDRFGSLRLDPHSGVSGRPNLHGDGFGDRQASLLRMIYEEERCHKANCRAEYHVEYGGNRRTRRLDQPGDKERCEAGECHGCYVGDNTEAARAHACWKLVRQRRREWAGEGSRQASQYNLHYQQLAERGACKNPKEYGYATLR